MPRDRSQRLLHRGASVALSATLLLLVAVPGTAVRGAEPNAAAGARHLSEMVGGSPNDFELLYERAGAIEHSDRPLWTGKYRDAKTGKFHLVYRDAANGAVAGA